jgi:hypothetical protein
MIDALEGREIITVDIKGAFLKAHVPRDLDLIVKMDGERS